MHHTRELNIKHEVSITLIKRSQAKTCKIPIKQVEVSVVVGGDWGTAFLTAAATNYCCLTAAWALSQIGRPPRHHPSRHL